MFLVQHVGEQRRQYNVERLKYVRQKRVQYIWYRADNMP